MSYFSTIWTLVFLNISVNIIIHTNSNLMNKIQSCFNGGYIDVPNYDCLRLSGVGASFVSDILDLDSWWWGNFSKPDGKSVFDVWWAGRQSSVSKLRLFLRACRERRLVRKGDSVRAGRYSKSDPTYTKTSIRYPNRLLYQMIFLHLK